MNHNRVCLSRLRRRCPSCGGPQSARTSRAGATRITTACAPWCRLNNALLAGGMRVRLGADLLPADDRDVRKSA